MSKTCGDMQVFVYRFVPLQNLLPQVLEEPENKAVYEETLQQLALSEVGFK